MANKNKKKKFSTSKIALWCVIVICIQIIIFAEYAMLKTGDLSSMYVLIGIPAALAPTMLGYLSKSKAENSVGGITYETAMREYELNTFVEDTMDAYETNEEMVNEG